MLPKSSITILWIDQPPAQHLELESALAPFEGTLIRLQSSDEVLSLLIAQDFAVILVDVSISDPNGLELLKTIRGNPRSGDTPILLITSDGGNDSNLEEAYSLGSVDHLARPVSPAILKSKLAGFRELQQNRAERNSWERREVGASFDRQKELWQTTLSSIGDAVIATDIDRRVTFMNAEAERLTGWSRAGAFGRGLDEIFVIINQDSREPVPCPVRKVLENGVVVGLANHTILIHRDGSESPIDDSASPIRDDARQLHGVVLVFRDISEKYKSDMALREARAELEIRVAQRTEELRREKAFLEAVLENIEDGIVACDENGMLTLFNRATKNLHGLPQEPLSPDQWAQHYHLFGPDGKSPLSKGEVPLFRALSGEYIKNAEMIVVPLTGEPRTLLASGQPLHDSNSRMLGAVVSMHDITDRRRVEKATAEIVREQELRRGDERVRDVLESISDGFVLLDSEWRITYMNASAERLNGKRRNEFLGKNYWDVYPATVGTAIHREFLRCAAERVPVSFENYYEPWDRWFEIDASPAIGNTVAVYYRDITSQKKSREELRQSEARNRAVVETALDCIIAIDHNGLITGFNPAAERTFGYRREEVLGKDLGETIIPHEYRHLHREGMRTLLQTGDARILDKRLELEAIRAGNERFDCELTVTRNPGEPPSFTGFLRDVTEIKRAAKALKDSEERFRLLADTIPNLAWMAQPDGHIFWYNRRWYEYTGTTPEAMEGWGWQSVHDPSELPKVLARWELSIKTGDPFNMVFPMKGADGQFRPFLTLVNPFRDENGKILFWFGTNTDITEQKISEERLALAAEIERNRSDLLTQVADASRSINAVMSAESITRLLAEEARRILGCKVAVASFVGRDGLESEMRAVSVAPELSEFRDSIICPEELAAQVCKTNLPLRFTEAETERISPWKSNETSQSSAALFRGWLGMPLVGHGGRNLGLIQLLGKEKGDFTLEDQAILSQLAATASVGLENARLYDSLRDQDKRKDEFLAILAHELRNPLAPVRTGLEILKVAGTSERAMNARDMMERQLGHMVRLIDDLMDVSRVSRGQMELRPEHTTIRTVVNMALETSMPLIEAAGHRLTVTLPDEPLPILADVTRLAQMLSNLINNAAKYTPSGGEIMITATRESSDLLLQVIDTGVGIPGDMLGKVFDLFTQVGRTLDRSQGGLGIGLSLVRRLVELHGGTVTAQSPGPSLGSTFTVRLPLELKTKRSESNGSSENSSPPNPLLRRVLIVDDNLDGAESLAIFLQLSGHQTLTAHTGPDALTAAKEFRPDVVFLDIGLPGMNGYEVAQRLRQDGDLVGCMIVAVTGWGSEDDRKRAREAGFDGHLTKPVDPAAVRKILKECLPVEDD